MYPLARPDNLGGIIHINDLEIRVTSYGSIEEQLTLFIKDFNIFIASTGSPTWNLPSNAHENGTVRFLLESLAKAEELDGSHRVLDKSEHIQPPGFACEHFPPSPGQSWTHDPTESAFAPATQGGLSHAPRRPIDTADGPIADVQHSKFSAPNPLIPTCTGRGDPEQQKMSSRATQLYSLLSPQLASKYNVPQPAITPDEPSKIAEHAVTWLSGGNGQSSTSKHPCRLRDWTAPTTHEALYHHCPTGISEKHESLLAAEDFSVTMATLLHRVSLIILGFSFRSPQFCIYGSSNVLLAWRRYVNETSRIF